MNSRRAILAASVAALAAAATGIALKVRRPPAPENSRWVQRVIYASVPDIVFEGADLAVVAEYVKRKISAGEEGGDGVDRDILGVFFLCTNYFDRARAPGAPVVVVRSPDPYDGGCSNPLAVFDP